MAQAADTGSGESTPFAKFANLGDTLIGAFGGGKSRQQQNFETREPKVKADGKPMLEEVMWFVAMPGTTAGTGDLSATLAPIAEGDVVRYSVAGFKWGQVIDQRKQLPPYAGFKAGQSCSGDVYTISLAGWSAETKNVQAAINAGFTVHEGRIQLRTQEKKDRYVLAQSRTGGNTNPAKDFTITVRRPTAQEKAFEQAADALFAQRPWERQPAMAGGGTEGPNDDPGEPF